MAVVKKYLKEVLIVIAMVFGIQVWMTRGHLGSGMTIDTTLQVADYPNQQNVKTLNDLSGKKTVFYFAAPWCTVCRYSIENMNYVAKILGSENYRFVVVMLSYDALAEVDEFFKDLDVSQVEIVTGSEAINEHFRIEAFPTVYFLDESLKVDRTTSGYSSTLGILLRTLFI
jgi:thiol-disulfide isomerase/thioredoxin